jgi:hypothetical protein
MLPCLAGWRAVQGKGAPQKCTGHSTASRRQQGAHTRKRVPTALPRASLTAGPVAPGGKTWKNQIRPFP